MVQNVGQPSDTNSAPHLHDRRGVVGERHAPHARGVVAFALREGFGHAGVRSFGFVRHPAAVNFRIYRKLDRGHENDFTARGYLWVVDIADDVPGVITPGQPGGGPPSDDVCTLGPTDPVCRYFKTSIRYHRGSGPGSQQPRGAPLEDTLGGQDQLRPRARRRRLADKEAGV